MESISIYLGSLKSVVIHLNQIICSLVTMLTGANKTSRSSVCSSLLKSNILRISSYLEVITSADPSTEFTDSTMSVSADTHWNFGRSLSNASIVSLSPPLSMIRFFAFMEVFHPNWMICNKLTKFWDQLMFLTQDFFVTYFGLTLPIQKKM